jgi:hypothetical protein
MHSEALSYLLYGLLGMALLVWVISRQLGERSWTTRRLVMMPLIFVVVAVLNGKTMGHDLDTGLAIGAFATGLVLAVVLGVARARTMEVRPGANGTIVTRGNRWTIAWWIVSIVVRVGMGVALGFLGIHEGTAEAMLFAALTIGVQNLWLARRGGLLGAVSPA